MKRPAPEAGDAETAKRQRQSTPSAKSAKAKAGRLAVSEFGSSDFLCEFCDSRTRSHNCETSRQGIESASSTTLVFTCHMLHKLTFIIVSRFTKYVFTFVTHFTLQHA